MSKRTCKDCRNRFSDEGTCPVRFGVSDTDDATNCDTFEPITVFHRITASPEVLAENLIHCIWYPTGRRWISTIIVWKEFENKSEAIAATVAKLKETEDDTGRN